MNSKKTNGLILFTFLVQFSLSSQIKPPATPQFLNISNSPFYFNSTLQNSQIHNYPLQPSALGGTNAESLLMEQSQRNAVPQPIIPPSDPYLLHQFVLSEYNQKNNSNGNSESTQQQHLLEIMNELHEDEKRYNNNEPVNNSEALLAYEQAYSQVKNMLTGKSKLSFIDASYYTEAAYGNSYMNYKEYKTCITQSAEFIKKWLKQNSLPNTPQNIHFAIQQFMGDTMSITVKLADNKQNNQTTVHYPFKYDYEDYDGKTDYRNFFSTKCLATGTGQCNSMPIVYLQLCEALGVKGYLTFAPFHSFIKYKNPEGKIINYEPTSHWTIPDKWYQDHLGVNQKAKKNGIYLDTLNKKQTVANSLVDLAISYMLKTPIPDTAFILKCLSTAQKYFPKNNNVTIYLAKSSLLSRQLETALRKHGIKDLSEVKNYADTNNLYGRLMKNEASLTALGYQELPQVLYDELLQHQKNGTNEPEAKTKKSLFKLTN
ncbi:MAG: hypothetical protein Q8M29_04945 [Bacteroidota bacterium]|nr:hypothetical protein [Bacteroidota bacterium]